MRAASEREDVRRSLHTLATWLTRELEGAGKAQRGRGHGVLTPASRGRTEREAESAAPQEHLAESLSTVVTRARWKAAGCRLALDRRAQSKESGGERESAEAQLATRERSLRARLAKLPDTSTWMLDQPFGLRATEPEAFDVSDEVAEKLELVANSYETLAFAVEMAIDLDEQGLFKGGPPPAFLYLLAEAQSALLAALAEAPTRSDSDQRDVFMWLKEQTTRHRIYVDRHMRLDDPADPKGASALEDRIRQTARDLLEERKTRRQRGQLLNKIKYHVRKLLDDGELRAAEVESLDAAIGQWREAGLESGEPALVDAVQALREFAREDDAAGDGVEALLKLLDRIPEPRGARTRRGGGSSSGKDPKRTAEILAEVRELLEDRTVVLLAPAHALDERESLESELGAASIDFVSVDVKGDADERWKTLSSCLDADDVDVFLLGVRLESEEYQRFKEECLERKTPFVRLPGSLAPSAVAHQITRQVGWRLRALRDSQVG
ncbi:MAG: hypothetical protein AAF726_12175 [Planctomycetota bacterium]